MRNITGCKALKAQVAPFAHLAPVGDNDDKREKQVLYIVEKSNVSKKAVVNLPDLNRSSSINLI